MTTNENGGQGPPFVASIWYLNLFAGAVKDAWNTLARRIHRTKALVLCPPSVGGLTTGILREVAQRCALFRQHAELTSIPLTVEHGFRFKGLQVAAPLFGGNLDPERLAAILGGP